MSVFTKALSILTITFASTSAYGQLKDSIKQHLDSSLVILKNNSLYAKRVNWKDVERQIYEKAKTSTTKAQTFEALKIAFDALGDKHAAYYQYDDEYRLNNAALVARYSDSIKAAWSRGPGIFAQMINGMAYINIPYCGVSKQADIDRYANWIYDGVAGLQKQNPKGWIVDLRLNGGGNIRPMLAGLAPLFKDGTVGYYIDRNSKASDKTEFSNGALLMNGVKQASIKNMIPGVGAVKVAVLIGAGTGSSGEGVAVILRQRKKTKLFGEQSAGLANSTDGFVFNGNQSYYLISTAYIGTKEKKVVDEVVKPDVFVKGNDAFGDLPNDKVAQAALRWLQ